MTNLKALVVFTNQSSTYPGVSRLVHKALDGYNVGVMSIGTVDLENNAEDRAMMVQLLQRKQHEYNRVVYIDGGDGKASHTVASHAGAWDMVIHVNADKVVTGCSRSWGEDITL